MKTCTLRFFRRYLLGSWFGFFEDFLDGGLFLYSWCVWRVGVVIFPSALVEAFFKKIKRGSCILVYDIIYWELTGSSNFLRMVAIPGSAKSIPTRELGGTHSAILKLRRSNDGVYDVTISIMAQKLLETAKFSTGEVQRRLFTPTKHHQPISCLK